MALINKSEKRRIPVYNDPNEFQAGEVAFDPEKCSGCLVCIKICPADALVENNKRPMMRPPGINECMGCGDCAAICPENAIVVIKSLRCTGFYKTIEQGAVLPPRLS